MGFRTIIVINNDFAELLVQDQEIGRKIYQAVLKGPDAVIGNIGYVLEQAHADTAKLGIIGNKGEFGFVELASMPHSHLDPNPELIMLKEAADKLGYYLTKRPAADKKKKEK